MSKSDPVLSNHVFKELHHLNSSVYPFLFRNRNVAGFYTDRDFICHCRILKKVGATIKQNTESSDELEAVTINQFDNVIIFSSDCQVFDLPTCLLRNTFFILKSKCRFVI